MMRWITKWFKRNHYRQTEVCIYEEAPVVKIAVYDGNKIDTPKSIPDFSKDIQMAGIKKEQRKQLNVFQIKCNMRRFTPNEYDRQKHLFENGSIIHAGDVGEFYGKSTKIKRFFYNKRKNIV